MKHVASMARGARNLIPHRLRPAGRRPAFAEHTTREIGSGGAHRGAPPRGGPAAARRPALLARRDAREALGPQSPVRRVAAAPSKWRRAGLLARVKIRLLHRERPDSENTKQQGARRNGARGGPRDVAPRAAPRRAPADARGLQRRSNPGDGGAALQRRLELNAARRRAGRVLLPERLARVPAHARAIARGPARIHEAPPRGRRRVRWYRCVVRCLRRLASV